VEQVVMGWMMLLSLRHSVQGKATDAHTLN